MSATATPNMIAPRTRLLVASADAVFRKRVLSNPLYAGVHREEVSGGAQALARLVEIRCDNVLLDRHLPDLDASEVAEIIRKRYPHIRVKLLDSQEANAELQDVEVRESLEARAKKGSEANGLATLRLQTRMAFQEEGPLRGMIGTSRAMQQVYALARLVAQRDTSVLIMGETGTGKELVAQGIHELSLRRKQPCVVVNCAAIPEALLETELFGHARGAFTGAVQSRLGRIHMAQGGTLFLDEIGDLPLSMQAKLLRFLQNGEVQRLGSAEVYRVDVRVLCATNVSLLDMVRERRFRQDLYYRLAVFPILMPPLRARAEDIPVLARHFLACLSAEVALPERFVSPPVIEWLQRQHWPGNVRELEHALERAFILAGNSEELCAEYFRSPSEMGEFVASG
ncbi:MAG: sigma-54 dependent transcriptional regulator [Candidatus Acidiferrum sp.]|jgi:transcriptional regulator with GAF, ATPase, and Fis domain